MASGASNDKAVIFETILSGPGMAEKVKVAFPISRKSILLLCRIIDSYISDRSTDSGAGFVREMSEEMREELKDLMEVILGKSGLEKFYERLKELE